MSADTVSMIRATQEDLPEMIELLLAAMEPDPLSHVLYTPRHTENARVQTESLMASLGARFTNPTNRCYIWKAVDPETNDLFGWCLIRWEDGTWTSKPMMTTDDSFATQYNKAVKRNWFRLLGDSRPHVVLGALYVRSDIQRSGIGRYMVEWLYSKYHLDRELVIVQTRALSEGFYQNLGWVTADCTEFDLSQFIGEGRGYGNHRSPQMLRHPITNGHS